MRGRGQEPFGGSPSGSLFVGHGRGHTCVVAGERVGHVRFVGELEASSWRRRRQARRLVQREGDSLAGIADQRNPAVVQRGISIWETWS